MSQAPQVAPRSAAVKRDPLPRRAVRQAGIQAQATIAGARGRVSVRRASGRRLLIGPWLAEVGFELLYWIPFARKLIVQAGIPPERVIVLSRGGVADWYGEAFGGYLDLYDLFEPDELHLAQHERISASGGQKHTHTTGLDREALARAQRRLDERFELLHPSVMFRRFRPVWMRRRTTAAVLRELMPAPVRASARPPGLPERYAALKLYASDCLPLEPSAAGTILNGVGRLAGGMPLVPLSAGARVDDHADLTEPDPRASGLPLASNLSRQTAIIQHAEMLISTYGGFAYLGVLSGVPTIALYQQPNFNFLHLDVLSHAMRQLPTGQAGGMSLCDIAHLALGKGPADLLSVPYPSASSEQN